MNEIEITQKTINKLDRQHQRSKTYYAIFASHSFDRAVITAKCARPTTFEQAKFTSDMINFFFKRNTSPYEFLTSVEEKANESIREYQNFQKAVSFCPYEKQILTSFAKWYAYSGFEVALLKCNIGYIIYFGVAIQERETGKITESEMLQTFANIIDAGDNLFTFHPGGIMRTFLQTVRKFNEIEQKIENRRKF